MAKKTYPSSMTFNLFAPGMTPIHQAGLGGLASSLFALDRAINQHRIAANCIPENSDSEKPWEVNEHSITLRWGNPENAKEFLSRLFRFSFGIKDGLIDLPGTYRTELSRLVRNELQLGLTLSFLQFGTHRKLADKQSRFVDPDGEGLGQLKLETRKCSSYIHQEFFRKLVDSKNRLRTSAIEQPSAFCPGAVVRHVAFQSKTRISRPVFEVVSAAFAAIGCLSLPVHAGMGVLLIPELTNLVEFARTRPRLTPTSPAECRVANASDAALQSIVRLKAKVLSTRSGTKRDGGMRGVHAMVMRPVPWNKKQKVRVNSLFVPAHELSEDEDALRKFSFALRFMPRRIRSKPVVESAGRGRSAKKNLSMESFFTDSSFRPLIADNLAQRKNWYAGFAELLQERNQKGEKLVERIRYETNAIRDLTMEKDMSSPDEMLVIKTVHRAVYRQMGKIYRDTMGSARAKQKLPPTQAVKNRWQKFQRDTRLSLLSAKTASQTHEAIMRLLGRSGISRELQRDDAIKQFLGLALGDDWRRARDICLVALVSYHSPKDPAEVVPGLNDSPETIDPSLT